MLLRSGYQVPNADESTSLKVPYQLTFEHSPMSSGGSKSDYVDPEILRLRDSGKALGLVGKDLVSFVQQAMKEEKTEKLRRDEMYRQEELRREELDLRREELEIRRLEMNALKEEISKISKPKQSDSYRVRLPEFNDGDDIESFLRHFESIATAHGWSQNVWAARLSPLLHGKARKAFLMMENEEISDYHLVKAALLREFQRTAEHYRREFREIRKKSDENFLQFLKRIKENFGLWLKLADVDPEDPKELRDLFLKEQLLSTLSADLAYYVREKKPDTVEDAAKLAFDHLEAKREARLASVVIGLPSPKKKEKGMKGQGPRKTPYGEQSSSLQEQSAGQSFPKATSSYDTRLKNIKCFRCGKVGHKAKDCSTGVRVLHSPDKVRLTSKEQEEFPKPYTPFFPATVNDKEVTALRDTGADVCCVRADLVKPDQYLNQDIDLEMADVSCARKYPLARVEVQSPLVQGELTVAVIQNLRCELILGNHVSTGDGKRIAVPLFPAKEPLQAVQTRAQKAAENVQIPLEVEPVEGLNITPEQLREMQEDDSSLQRARTAAEKTTELHVGRHHHKVTFKRKKGILYRVFNDGEQERSQVCVPRQLRKQVMQLAHDPPMSGHLGGKKTQLRVWQDFYWPGMCGDIRRYCLSCEQCQRVTPRGKIPKVPLGKMPLPSVPFERVGVDIVGPIKPASDGHRYILVMVDFATRYPEAEALKNVEAETVAEALWNMWSRLGVPNQVLTDRGSQFTGRIMQEVYKLLAIKGLTTTPYHAQCNGLVERFNGTLKSMLKKLCMEEPTMWRRYLPAVLFAYREVPQESTGFSPFELLYGRSVRGPMAILREIWTKEKKKDEPQTAAAYVLDLRNRIAQTCEIAQRNLAKASDRQKKHFDKKTKNRTFQEGDQVLLLLPEKKNKLQMAWQGPFEIESRMGECDYKIRMKGKTKLIHANLLKKYLQRPQEVNTMSVVTKEEWEDVKTRNDIPVVPLQAEETVDDVVLDPESPEISADIKGLISEFPDVVTDLPLNTSLAQCEIKLLHDQPINTRQYPLPFSQRETVKEEVKAMLKMGVIEPSSSPYSSPIVLVEKKDGKVRFCTDYRKINQIVVNDTEPMPDMEYLFSKLASAKYLSKIDLSKGYWQVPMAQKDKTKTAFSTPQGSYQWTVMPFGLKTAGAIFSRMMRKLLLPLKMPEIDNFMDDILVATDSKERHLECLRALFSRLREVSLSARPTKCELGFKQLEYLGHVIGNGIIKPTGDKINKIRDTPRPTTKRQVRSFLGLAGFYRKFIPNFAEIALPLTDATKGKKPNQVQWTPEMEKAFCLLKEALSSKPVCVLPQFDKTFVIRTDASDSGLGAILLQDQGQGLQIIACASKKLLPAERNYSTIEKECLAMVWGIGKFNPYLYGRQFFVQSDHKPLQYLQTMRATNKRIMRWSLLLQPYTFTIEAIPGKENVGADYLSRIDD